MLTLGGQELDSLTPQRAQKGGCSGTGCLARGWSERSTGSPEVLEKTFKALLPASAFAGKPTGEAYVQFVSGDEAARALKKRNHEHMGNRYIE